MSWEHRSGLYWCLFYSCCCQNESLLHFHPTKNPHSQVNLPAQMESLQTKKQIHLKRNIQWFHTWSLQTETWLSSRLKPFDEQVKIVERHKKTRLAYCKREKKNVIKLCPSTAPEKQPGPVWPAPYPQSHIHEVGDRGQFLTPPPITLLIWTMSTSFIQDNTRLHMEKAQPCQAPSKHTINLH